MNLIPAHEDDNQKQLENIGLKTLNKFDAKKITVNPLTCDKSLFGHLAATLDVSISGLDEDEARAYLQNAREIKKYIGSKYAVRIAASSVFGEDIKVRPWNEIKTIPGTYKIEVDVTPNKPVTDENLLKVQRLINEAKPASRHLVGITINMSNTSVFNQSVTTVSNEVITILPKVLKDIKTVINKKVLIASHTIEKIEIRPKGV